MGAGIGAALVGAGRRVSWASSGARAIDGPACPRRGPGRRALGPGDGRNLRPHHLGLSPRCRPRRGEAGGRVRRHLSRCQCHRSRHSPGGGRPGGAIRWPLRRRWHHRRPARPLELTAPVPLGPIGSLGSRRVRRHPGAGAGDLRGPGRRVGLENVLCRLDERDDRAAPRRRARSPSPREWRSRFSTNGGTPCPTWPSGACTRPSRRPPRAGAGLARWSRSRPPSGPPDCRTAFTGRRRRSTPDRARDETAVADAATLGVILRALLEWPGPD